MPNATIGAGIPRPPFRPSLTPEDLAKLLTEAGATLRLGSTAAEMAEVLAMHEWYFKIFPFIDTPNLSLLIGLKGRQRRALISLWTHLSAAAAAFTSDVPALQVAADRFHYAVDELRLTAGLDHTCRKYMAGHLNGLARAARMALDLSDNYLRAYLLQATEDSERARRGMGEAEVAKMLKAARDMLARKPETRALIFIRHVIEGHVADTILGTVEVGSDSPQGPTLTLGIAIAKAWGIDPPGEGAIRSAWLRAPGRQAGGRRGRKKRPPSPEAG